MAGKKSDLHLEWSANAEKMLSEMGKTINKQQQAIDKLKDQNRHAREALKSMQDLGRGGGKSGDEIKSGMDKAKDSAREAGKVFRSVLGLFGMASLGGAAVATIRNIIKLLEEAKQLRQEFTGETLSLDRLAQPLASLRKDVSQAGIDAARRSIESVATETRLPHQTAERLLYFAESVYAPGSEQARTAAIESGKLAAAVGMDAEAAAKLPNILRLNNANTAQQQKVVLNKILAAASASVAEAPEYVASMPKMMGVGFGLGYNLDQVLANYNAMIAMHGGDTAEAATATLRGYAVTAGRQNKAMDFLGKHAAERGMDFRAMNDPQRREFVRQLYLELEAQGRKDEMKELDAKGFQAILMMSSPQAREIEAGVAPKIAQAGQTLPGEAMFADYTSTRSAFDVENQLRAERAKAAAGRKHFVYSQFEQQVETINKLGKEDADTAKRMLFYATMHKGIEQRAVGYTYLYEQLAAEMEQTDRGSEKQKQLEELWDRLSRTNFLSTNKDLVNEVYESTQGFTAIQRLGEPYDANRLNPDLIDRGTLRSYQAQKVNEFFLSEQTGKDLVRALEENTKAQTGGRGAVPMAEVMD
ncbi:MAG: hypothetical protein JXA82_18100 [Sedimentisphaerales bacterium]|nr:hypothetical protein [Sedimentisphaerales bacterium]